MRTKITKSNIAYIYYESVLYRMIIQHKDEPIAGSFSPSFYNFYSKNTAFDLGKDFDYAEEFLKLFALYISGQYTSEQKTWNPATGCRAYVERLNGFRVVGEHTKYYKYTYIDSNGKRCEGNLYKTYPGIEAIFNYCR